MKMPWESLIDDLFGLADKFIEDKDKKNEFSFKVQELQFKLRESLLQTTTIPWVDGFVKILIAFRDIILPLLRPLGAAAMTAFGMYCHLKGIDMGGAANHTIFDAAFPAWGASRHVNKTQAQKEETKRKQIEQSSPENNSFIFPE